MMIIVMMTMTTNMTMITLMTTTNYDGEDDNNDDKDDDNAYLQRSVERSGHHFHDDRVDMYVNAIHHLVNKPVLATWTVTTQQTLHSD
jgi:pyocin large subunit-like protein